EALLLRGRHQRPILDQTASGIMIVRRYANKYCHALTTLLQGRHCRTRSVRSSRKPASRLSGVMNYFLNFEISIQRRNLMNKPTSKRRISQQELHKKHSTNYECCNLINHNRQCQYQNSDTPGKIYNNRQKYFPASRINNLPSIAANPRP